ncbi:MAG: hypothetical protein P1V81_00940 [Planctomycetota bacterium]|nr:hypothetical protein [Planctomycetota bacterium]
MSTHPEAPTTDVLEVQCDDCGATLTMPRHRFAAVCPYCASGSVIDRPVDPNGEASARREAPDFILGFDVTRAEAERRVAGWLGRRRLFAPGAVRNAKVTDTQGIYLPAWLYGSVADARYEASIGENYTVTETYTTTDAKGKTTTHTRTRTETEWRPLSGPYHSYVLDVLVTASAGLGNDELESIEPFDLRALRRYDPAVVSGFAAEEATLDADTGFERARDEAMGILKHQVKQFLPGDSSQLKHLDAEFAEENTDLVLLPIWVFAARYQVGSEERRLRILVNGQTGEVQGEVPNSKIKIAIFTLAMVALVALLVLVGFAIGGMS